MFVWLLSRFHPPGKTVQLANRIGEQNYYYAQGRTTGIAESNDPAEKLTYQSKTQQSKPDISHICFQFHTNHHCSTEVEKFCRVHLQFTSFHCPHQSINVKQLTSNDLMTGILTELCQIPQLH